MTKSKLINTDSFSEKLRLKAIDVSNKSISITNFVNSDQEKDIKEGPNCDGYGRVRTFKYTRNKNFPVNPLPIFPAAKALNLNSTETIRAQVFQNSVCNWRCWYCFVDFKLLSGSKKFSSFKNCNELLDLYLGEPDPPKMLDLTGGQPDLTPEWVPWMMEELILRGKENDIYLWSDDNLSNDYFWRYLTSDQISLIESYKNYGRVCCFKGFNNDSFSINTLAEPKLFDNQLILAKRMMEIKIDLYFYITLTSPTSTDFNYDIPIFFDKIQAISENMPLRIVPLEIFNFTPVISRKKDDFDDLIKGQYLAIDVWQNEIEKRFSQEMREKPITEIKL
jgi:uncharacterized Fe-S cluster-containing radical SAM superfamily protein